MYSIIKQAKKERKQKSKKILIPHLKEGVLYFLDCSQQDKKTTIKKEAFDGLFLLYGEL